MPSFQSRATSDPTLPDSLRSRLQTLCGRLPGYVLLLGTILRRRSIPAAYMQALAQEAGFGRMPVRVPGGKLPGFRRLGWVAILGVILHVLLRQWKGNPQVVARRNANFSVIGLRDDAGTLLSLIRWVFSGLTAKRTRIRTEV